MSMNKTGATGFKRIFKALTYSIKGLKSAFKNEAAFRQETYLAIILIPLAIGFAENGVELAILMLSLGLVFVAELANSAFEAVVDRIGKEHHILSGQAKDIGSAIVLVALIICVVVWGLIFFF